jgi:xylulokinase
MELAMGIDLGTTAVKVGLFAVADGRPVAVSTREYALDTPHPGWAELDPDVYWTALVAGARDAIGRASAGDRVVSIGLSSQGQTFVMLDAHQRPLRKAIAWVDTRAEAELREFMAAVGDDDFYARTGSPFPNGIDSAPKLLWVRRHEPETFARAAYVLVLPAYIALRLTGRPVTDPGNAASTSWYDVREARWWSRAIEFLGVRAEQLGQVAPGGTLMGGLELAAADELGLPAGVPVGAGANDQTCAAVALGNRGPGTLSATIGTAMAIVGTAAPEAPPPTGGVLVGQHPLGGGRLLLAYAKTAAIVLTWFRDKMAVGCSYEDLLREAETAPAGCDGLLCLPHLAGTGTPSFRESVRGGFVGLGLGHERRHFVRAIVEGVCHGARDALALVRRFGAEADCLIASGGAVRSPFWTQALADSVGMPVIVPECAEAACRGAALLGLLAAGMDSARDWPGDTGGEPCVYTPDSTRSAAYDEAYCRYCVAMDALYPGARE